MTDVTITALPSATTVNATDAFPVVQSGVTRQISAATLMGAGLSTQILVGGGATALPVWTVATGTGAPVRASNATLNSPTINTPTIVSPTFSGSTVFANLITSGLIAANAAAPTIASAATIAPTKLITFISGTAAISTITAPAPVSAGGGQIVFIPTGVFTMTTSGNIALAVTAVVNVPLVMTYDTTTAKWYPSYYSSAVTSPPTVASATTIAPTTSIFFVSGTTAVATITPPSGINVITIIPSGAFTTTTAGNIALASTAVVSKILIMVYDSATAKWYPSY
jgi:hypothetical protein